MGALEAMAADLGATAAARGVSAAVMGVLEATVGLVAVEWVQGAADAAESLPVFDGSVTLCFGSP